MVLGGRAVERLQGLQRFWLPELEKLYGQREAQAAELHYEMEDALAWITSVPVD